MTKRELFLANARGERTNRTPIWIMRQAGRYMKEYLETREKYSFETICQTPELAAEVTMQPIDKFGFDAAIIFSDILFILEPLNINLKYDPGPILSPLLEKPEQTKLYQKYDASDKLGFVGKAIKIARQKLGNDTALLGFCGAPFTLFSYLCGASGYIGLHNAVRFLIRYPDEGTEVLKLLTGLSYSYLKMQLKSGTDAIQIFDTWAGELSLEDFNRWSKPYIKSIIDRLHDDGYLTSVYIRGSYHLLESIKEFKTDIMSIDWKTPLADAQKILAPSAIQGNLSPSIMLGTESEVKQRAEMILNEMKDYSGFIFNLGHGILPETPTANVKALVELVQNYRREPND